MTDQQLLRGVIPILSMPFDESGAVDEDNLRREVAWAVAAGAHGIGLALASEISRLTSDERRLVATAVATEIAGRVPLVLHVGSQAPVVSAELAHEAHELGAQCVMVPPPTFEARDFDVLLGFFRTVASATTLPLVLQDLPEARVTPDLARILAEEFPGRIAVKIESAPSPLAVQRMVAATAHLDIPVLGGAGGLNFLSEIARGATGTMPGCALTDYFVAVWDKVIEGDSQSAGQLFAAVQPLLALITLPEYVIPMHRHLLTVRGIIDRSASRLPALLLSDLDESEVARLWSEVEVASPIEQARSRR